MKFSFKARQGALVLALCAAFPAFATNEQVNQCPPNATNCTGSNQFVGDISSPSTATNTHSVASQAGVASNSNASGVDIGASYDNRAQTTQNANNTTTGTISGGNTNSTATGGAAIGNQSDNKSSATTGASNSGGNVLGGATSNSGGNILGGASAVNGPNTNTNSAAGGAGGQGGAGGTASSNGTVTGINGQQQGIDRSGNSANANTVTGGDQRNTSANTNAQQQANTGTNAQGQTSANRVTGGAQTQTGGAQNASTRSGVATSGNSNVTVDAANRSVTTFEGDRTLFIPAVVPPTAPSSLGVGQIMKETSACGPLQAVIKRPVVGVIAGFFTDSNIDQGFSDELDPQGYVDRAGIPQTYLVRPAPDGGMVFYGHQVTETTAVLGTGGSKNIAIGGGGGSSQNWGQGGGGSSSSIQQLVTTIRLRTCEVGRSKPEVRAQVETRPMLQIVDKVGE